MTPPPAISVIIPAFNAAHTLDDALDSIHRQGRTDLEVIVIDDGSTDDTPRRCAALGDRIRYHRQANAGVAAARNAGLAIAAAPRITFLDADDAWCDGALARLDQALDGHPHWLGAQGRIQCVVGDRRPHLDAPRHGAPWYGPALASALFHRAIFDRIGRFDPSLRVAEDLDWFIRAREAGCEIGQVTDTTLSYRLHAGSLTRGKDAQDKNLLLTVKRAIDRRRSAAAARTGARTGARPEARTGDHA